ncbi:MAG: arylsulfotransferase family protein [Sphingobium sp.]
MRNDALRRSVIAALQDPERAYRIAGPERRKRAPGRSLLTLLRNAVAGLCALALLAFAVAWSVRHPNGRLQKAVLTLADAPRFVVETVTNVVSDRFALSRTPDAFSDRKTYRPVVNHTAYKIDGLVMRIERGARPQAGWRVLYGIFRIDGEPSYAAVALSPAFAIEHVWLLNGKVASDTVTPFEPAPYPHGFALLQDGSIVVGFDTNYHSARIGFCGNPIWSSPAYLNHAIYPVDGGRSAWGVGAGDTIQQVDMATGRVLRTLSMEAIRRANSDISALDMLRIDDNGLGANDRLATSGSRTDPYHLNDAEPLTPDMAKSFPQFRAGDLLLSFRSLNMIAVLDPATLRIKWLDNDHLFRQHDPDWEPNGHISVLDNQMGRGFSRIVDFDPRTGGHRVAVPGEPLNFYTRIRGKHQSLADGGMAITSSGQGRVVETDRDGHVAVEILNRDNSTKGENFLISEEQIFPANHPVFEKAQTCTKWLSPSSSR